MNRGFGNNQADRWNTVKRNNSEEVKMTRIKIRDLPKDMKIGKDEMMQIFGGQTLFDLKLQQAMQAEYRMLTQTANIIKEYDDTTKALINNIR